MQTREELIRLLRSHEAELRAAGIESLSLFGSVARNETVANDLDVAVRLEPSFSKPGLDYFSRLDDLEKRLSEILGCPVDVVEEPVRKQRFQLEIDRDRAVASEKPIRRLEDIVENAKAILRYTDGMDLATFREDRKSADAVERCLERISDGYVYVWEAASKLGDEAFSLVPGQPRGQIRALGNRLRHEYDAIREDRLWDIVHTDLPSLCSACKQASNRLRGGLPA